MDARVLGLLFNGELRDPGPVRPLLEAAAIVALDGGLRHARALGVVPRLLIGDLDSVDPELLAGYSGPVERYPRVKDETDGELGIRHALAAGYDRVVMVAAFGDRWDHTLANMALLLRLRRASVQGIMTDGVTDAFLIDRSWEGEGPSGEIMSLISLTARSTGVTIRGLRYTGEELVIRREGSLGISNEFTGARASISVRRGLLLAIRTRAAGAAAGGLAGM